MQTESSQKRTKGAKWSKPFCVPLTETHLLRLSLQPGVKLSALSQSPPCMNKEEFIMWADSISSKTRCACSPETQTARQATRPTESTLLSGDQPRYSKR